VSTTIRRTFVLTLLEPSTKKKRLAEDLLRRYRCALEFVVSSRAKASKVDLQRRFYRDVRSFGIPSMMSSYLFGDAVPILKTGGTVGNVTLPYNIPRSGGITETKRGNPILSIRVTKERIAIPIDANGAFARFKESLVAGWRPKAFRLSADKAFVVTEKHFAVKTDQRGYDSVIGIDVGVKRLAALSVLDMEGGVLKQLYLGQDVGDRQRDLSVRRSKLVSYREKGSRYAKQALGRLRRYESDFTKTRSHQIAHEIISLAKKYNAFIAVEELRNLYQARGSRKSNRKSKRLPYSRFRAALERLATQDGRLVVPVYPRGTSHECSRCGSRGVRKGATFTCWSCGYTANADRNASVNIARRAAFQRPKLPGQISARNLQVMAGALVHAGAEQDWLATMSRSEDKPAESTTGS